MRQLKLFQTSFIEGQLYCPCGNESAMCGMQPLGHEGWLTPIRGGFAYEGERLVGLCRECTMPCKEAMERERLWQFSPPKGMAVVVWLEKLAKSKRKEKGVK